MKRAIIAAALFALTTPALAFGDHADFDCGDGIEVSIGKVMSVLITDPKRPHVEGSPHYPYPDKGQFNLRWTAKGLWLNGKACTFITDKMVWQRGCAKGDKESCEELKNWDHR